jgi:hypothetical protein
MNKVRYAAGVAMMIAGLIAGGGASAETTIGEHGLVRADLEFSMGKFNAPIGFEAVDAPDMYQFSHSLRIDTSTEEIFVDRDGEMKDSTTSLAFEMTYTF